MHALDYLLKPADDERLGAALNKVREYYSTQHQDEQSQKLVSLVAELTGDDCEEILRKLANGEPVETNPYPDVLAIKDGSEVTRVNVQDIQWIDAAGDYMCVHALDHISGEYHLILQNDTELKVSRSHRDKVKAAMKM